MRRNRSSRYQKWTKFPSHTLPWKRMVFSYVAVVKQLLSQQELPTKKSTTQLYVMASSDGRSDTLQGRIP